MVKGQFEASIEVFGAAVTNSILLREDYVVRLKALLKPEGERWKANMMEVINILELLRMSTIEVVENINTWRSEMFKYGQRCGSMEKKNETIPFIWENENYLLKMANDTEFLGTIPSFTTVFNISTSRNPLFLSKDKNKHFVMDVEPDKIDMVHKCLETEEKLHQLKRGPVGPEVEHKSEMKSNTKKKMMKSASMSEILLKNRVVSKLSVILNRPKMKNALLGGKLAFLGKEGVQKNGLLSHQALDTLLDHLNLHFSPREFRWLVQHLDPEDSGFVDGIEILSLVQSPEKEEDSSTPDRKLHIIHTLKEKLETIREEIKVREKDVQWWNWVEEWEQATTKSKHLREKQVQTNKRKIEQLYDDLNTKAAQLDILEQQLVAEIEYKSRTQQEIRTEQKAQDLRRHKGGSLGIEIEQKANELVEEDHKSEEWRRKQNAIWMEKQRQKVRFRRKFAAIDIQRIYRGFLARKVTKVLEQERNARLAKLYAENATKIQSIVRMFTCRMKYIKLRDEHRMAMRQKEMDLEIRRKALEWEKQQREAAAAAEALRKKRMEQQEKRRNEALKEARKKKARERMERKRKAEVYRRKVLQTADILQCPIDQMKLNNIPGICVLRENRTLKNRRVTIVASDHSEGPPHPPNVISISIFDKFDASPVEDVISKSPCVIYLDKNAINELLGPHLTNRLLRSGSRSRVCSHLLDCCTLKLFKNGVTLDFITFKEKENSSASKIQARFRGRKVRKNKLPTAKPKPPPPPMSQDKAATKIQASFRGKQARRKLPPKGRKPPPPPMSQDKAAT